MNPQSMFLAKIRKKKKSKNLLLKIFIFYNFENLCILHGHVFVMNVVGILTVTGWGGGGGVGNSKSNRGLKRDLNLKFFILLIAQERA